MGAEAGSAHRWRTARERDRLRARRLIRSRVASRVADDGAVVDDGTDGDVPGPPGDSAGDSSAGGNDDGATRLPPPEEEANVLLRHLRAIVRNDLSAFSAASLARHGRVLDRPLPAPLPVDRTTGSDEGEALHELAAMYSTALPWEVNRRQDASAPSHSAGSGAGAEAEEPALPQPTTLAASKYGVKYVEERLVPYMRHLRLRHRRQLTLMEYASLLGRHGIASLLLLGGTDPTVGCVGAGAGSGDDECGGGSSEGRKGKGGDDDDDAPSSAERAGRRVLSLLHSVGDRAASRSGADEGAACAATTIPLSIWCYAIRSVIEMRMNAADERRREPAPCGVCARDAPLVRFGPPCRHAFCEPCLWDHLVETLPSCDDLRRNVVTCPRCRAAFEGFRCCQEGDRNSIRQKERRKGSAGEAEEKKNEGVVESFGFGSLNLNDASDGGEHPDDKDAIPSLELRRRRRDESLTKFRQLPEDATKMKRKKTKRKKERNPIHSTWHDALLPAISACQTRDVRSDRFFRAVTSSPHLLLGYLHAGVDINARNDYGQTALYVACWKGPSIAARRLLEYGADAGVAANGGSTCRSVAARHERADVLQLLDRFDAAKVDPAGSIAPSTTHRPSKTPRATVLIDPTVDHPGAGACTVDDALSEGELRELTALWRSLPKAGARAEDEEGEGSFGRGPGTDSDFGAKASYRPSRSYFCDAETRVQHMLKGCVDAARRSLSSSASSETSEASPSEHSRGGGRRPPPASVFERMRFLSYDKPGGVLPPHVDLCRVDDASGMRSTHTFILYLTNCEDGGGTALLNNLRDGRVLAVARPRRGRALLFPHLCPHSGLEVGSAPKLLLRGEVLLDLPKSNKV